MAHIEDRWFTTDESGARVPTARSGKGLRWRARWHLPTGDEQKKSFERKTDAERHLATVISTIGSGDYVDPARGRLTFGEFAETWYSSHRGAVEEKTAASYRSLLDAQILPVWGRVPLSGVRNVDVKRWLGNMRQAGMSISRTRQSYAVLAMILDLAVQDGRIPKNESRGVKKPPVPSGKKHHYLTHAELRRLAEECGPYRTFVLFLGYTGLRWGEATALTVGDIDLKRHRVSVDKAFTEVNGRITLKDTKTHGRRTVPVPRFLAEMLQPSLEGEKDSLVFASPHGAPLRSGNFRRVVFDPAKRRLGIENMTPHGLRHTCASLCVAAGAQVKTVQRMLGHKSASMTLDTYADLFDGDLDAVADALDVAASSGSSALL